MNTENTNQSTASTTNDATTTAATSKPSKSAKPAKKASTKKPHVKAAKPAKDQKPAKKSPAKKAPAKKAPAAKKKSPAKKAAKPSKASSKRTADNSNRNFGRIRFNGESMSKGRAVHAVVAAFVEKKKPTAAALKAAFPDELLKNYGIVREIGQARKYNVNGKSRYFTGSEDVIKTKDGKQFAVCNQFSTENIKPFMSAARKHGFNMTAEK